MTFYDNDVAVERVAKALWEHDFHNDNGYVPDWDGEDANYIQKMLFMYKARVAIEAYFGSPMSCCEGMPENDGWCTMDCKCHCHEDPFGDDDV